METRERWIDDLASLPSAGDVQKNRQTHQNQRGPTVTHERTSVLSGSEHEARALQELHTAQDELLSDQILSSERLLSKANWIPEKCLAEITVRKGPMFQLMGFSAEGTDYFFAEEALFLLETGHLELFCEGLPISIQQAYSLLLSNEDMPYSTYRVYAHLIRSGYIVYAHSHHCRVMALRSGAETDPARDACPQAGSISPARCGDNSRTDDIGAAGASARDCHTPDPAASNSNAANDNSTNPSATTVATTTADAVVTNMADSERTLRHQPAAMCRRSRPGRSSESGPISSQLSSSAPSSSSHCPEWVRDNVFRLMLRGQKRLHEDCDAEHDAMTTANESTGCNHRQCEPVVPAMQHNSAEAPTVNDGGDCSCSLPACTVDSQLLPASSLISSSDGITKENILSKLDIFSARTHCSSPGLQNGRNCVQFDLEVYLHRTGFRKMAPGKPSYYVCIQNGLLAKAPSLSQLQSGLGASDGVPVRWAVAAENRVHFYSLDAFSLPTLHPA
eukprot:scpid74892/ scgid31120/ tRNA-splicing endonuclease subunit Sen54; tRNA-intron endonuclease Sen54